MQKASFVVYTVYAESDSTSFMIVLHPNLSRCTGIAMFHRAERKEAQQESAVRFITYSDLTKTTNTNTNTNVSSNASDHDFILALSSMKKSSSPSLFLDLSTEVYTGTILIVCIRFQLAITKLCVRNMCKLQIVGAFTCKLPRSIIHLYSANEINPA